MTGICSDPLTFGTTTYFCQREPNHTGEHAYHGMNRTTMDAIAYGFRAGAEAMRNAAAKWADTKYDYEYCLSVGEAIRDLPLPEYKR